GDPSRQPSQQPSSQPTRQPSSRPSNQPTRQPTSQPFGDPTDQPSGQPIGDPSRQPSQQPSSQPTGRVLPIGGLKEKILAAKRAKLTTVILPRRNKKDLEETPKHLLKGIQLAFVETMDDVMKIALRRSAKATPSSGKSSAPPAPTRIRPLGPGKGRRSHELPATAMANKRPAQS
ncbi:S16 family serine protease, partial [Nitrospira sp. BLG_2]|uniref:PT domain-containing protein n=1 Tax=Nitrospira sp. BLG_2 TaxID=3397507 RepID=UPI003B9AB71B